MKVIMMGDPNAHWSLQVNCTGKGNGEEYKACASILEIEKEDLEITRSVSRNDTTEFFTFACPICGVKTDVDDKLIPEKIKAYVRKKQ